MPLTADLTIRETAALSGVPKATIEKAIEARVLRTLPAPPRLRGARGDTSRSGSRLFPFPQGS